jgi:uncharacterized phiE125 gp8 family phage protein
MTLVQLEPPAALAVEETTVWDHLRVDRTVDIGESPTVLAPVDRAYIYGLIEAAIGEVDGADGLLGRALVTQGWMFSIDCGFPRVIEVPLPPLRSIDEIRYVDPAGDLHVLDPDRYRVCGIGGAAKAEITPAPGCAWPETAYMREAIIVRFTCGYGDTSADVPAPIRQALLETVATRYAFRETVGSGATFMRIPAGAQAALDNYRLWTF